MSELKHSTAHRLLLRVVTPLGVVVGVGWAAWQFGSGRTQNGIYAVAVVALIVVSGIALSQRATDVQPQQAQRSVAYQFYAFFGGGALACLALSILMFAGAIHGGVVLAIGGLVATAACIYVLIKGTRGLQRDARSS